MISFSTIIRSILVLSAALALPVALLADEAHVPVVKITLDLDVSGYTCNHCTIKVVTDNGAPALLMTIPANQNFPGVGINAPAGGWDLSAAKGVRLVGTNSGSAEIPLTLRVLNDVPGVKEPFNIASASFEPGDTRLVQTIFGKDRGNPGFALDPKKVTGLYFYVGGAPAATERTLLIKALETFDTEQVQPPPDIGRPPGDGLVLWLDPSKEETATLDANRQVSALADRSGGHHDAKAASPDAMPTLTANGMKIRPMLHFTGKQALTVDPIRTTPGGATVFVVFTRLIGPHTPGPNPTLFASQSAPAAAPDAAPNFQIPGPGPKAGWKQTTVLSVENVPIGPITIGKDFSGNIDEVLVYDHTFDDETDRQIVYEFLGKKWNADYPPLAGVRTEPLDPVPARPHADLPLTDQDNKGKWVLDPKFSDEFTGTTIDLTRYVLSSSFFGWVGRPPGWFEPKNVSIKDGALRLKLDKSTPDELKAHPKFTYTTGYIRTKELTGYGYYEIEAKPAFSEFDCAFWLMDTGDTKNQTELDIFEMGIHSAKCANNDYMTAHVWADKGHTWATGAQYHVPWNLADAYHTYGFEWTKDDIKWYIDGSLVRELKNTNWHLPMYLIFDAEPMLDWMGPIDDKDFPAEYAIKHLKVWRQAP